MCVIPSTDGICRPNTCVGGNRQVLRVLYTNADGLLNKRQDLQNLIDSFERPPDVIAITEVKAKLHNHQLLSSERNMEGYNIFSHGLEGSNERGVLIYVASHFLTISGRYTY